MHSPKREKIIIIQHNTNATRIFVEKLYHLAQGLLET